MANPVSLAMQNSHFAKLPLELRRRTYKEVLTFQSLDVCSDVFDFKAFNDANRFGNWWVLDAGEFYHLSDRLQVTCVCKQMREESARFVLEANSSNLLLATQSPEYMHHHQCSCSPLPRNNPCPRRRYAFPGDCFSTLYALKWIPSIFRPKSVKFCLHFRIDWISFVADYPGEKYEENMRFYFGLVFREFPQSQIVFALYVSNRCDGFAHGSTKASDFPVIYLHPDDPEAGRHSMEVVLDRAMLSLPTEHSSHPPIYCNIALLALPRFDRCLDRMRRMVRLFNDQLAEAYARSAYQTKG
ncbi:hypothetical protein Q7P37_001619 [Cladosporium fusiforme]